MHEKVFKKFRDIIYQSSGINLSNDKIHLLSNRILKRMRALALNDPADYLDLITKDNTGEELTLLLNAISTNVTHFFREAEHFDKLSSILTEHFNSGKKQLRIWCAASSTGEEPYTIAMTVAQLVDLTKIDFKLLATDINIDVLQQAKKGCYSESQIARVPQHLRTKYFTKKTDENGIIFNIKPALKEYLRFAQLNLIETPYPLKTKADIIFCRNVLIYFDLNTRTKVIKELNSNLISKGYLFLSRSENMLSIKHNFDCLPGSVYRSR